MQKRVLEVLKTWYFPYSAFWSAGQGGGAIAPPAPPPGYATDYDQGKNCLWYIFGYDSDSTATIPLPPKWKLLCLRLGQLFFPIAFLTSR